MNQKKAKLITPIPDDAIRAGDFQLLPTINRPPVITSHPARNFNQTTWGTLVKENGSVNVKYNSVASFNSIFTVRVGTACSWGLYCSDPSNLDNTNDTTNITFVWKRDNFPIHSVNRQNSGYGTPFMSFTEEECVQGIDGTYVCELTNRSGTTTSVPFTLRVIDLDNDIKLYTNLLLNGDAEGGLDEWTSLSGLIRGVTGKTTSNRISTNTLTGEPHDNLSYQVGSSYTPPLEFRFSTKVNRYHLFSTFYNEWNNKTGGSGPGSLLDYNTPTANIIDAIPSWFQYAANKHRYQTIPNETPDGVQGFFPSPKYIDDYNRNLGLNIKLNEELDKSKSRPLNYFTRNIIKFQEPATTEFSQVVALDGLESLINGEVGGVDYLSAQLFSYVAIAISRYTIKVTIEGKVREFNWYIHKFDTFRHFLAGGDLERYAPDKGTTIEIIPHTDDTTIVSIDVLNKLDEVLITKNFEGPKALDIWALKEKTDWSTSLYGIVQFFEQNNNPIKVFGQTYVNTNTIKSLFYNLGGNNKGNLDIENMNSQFNQTTNQNAKFIFKRMSWFYSNFNKPIPRKNQWQNVTSHPLFKNSNSEWSEPLPNRNNAPNNFSPSGYNEATRVDKAYIERGAECFMAVGGNVTLPGGATSLRVRVQFTNTSPAREDTNPANKDWDRADIYNTLFRIKPGGLPVTSNHVFGGAKLSLEADAVPRPHFAYGPPRCGITKMKLLIVPNADIASKNHTTFSIPAPQFTVAGVARDLALKPVWDSSQDNTFNYRSIYPEQGITSPEPTTTFIEEQTIETAKQEYTDSLNTESEPSDLDANTKSSEEVDTTDANIFGHNAEPAESGSLG